MNFRSSPISSNLKAQICDKVILAKEWLQFKLAFLNKTVFVWKSFSPPHLEKSLFKKNNAC